LVTNGFDEDDFSSFKAKRSDRFLIRHVGIVNERCDPRPFTQAVSELCKEDEEIKKNILVEFVGEVHPSFKEFVISDVSLSVITKFTATVPHQELMNMYSTSSVLLLILTGYKDAEGYMPGKLFEYLATGLPILGVGPQEGDAAVLLNEIQSGSMIDGSDPEGIKNCIRKWFEEWKSYKPDYRIVNASKYSRKELTGELIKLLR
jgi:glycosyltransferase involved in cell wall biosynthesis